MKKFLTVFLCLGAHSAFSIGGGGSPSGNPAVAYCVSENGVVENTTYTNGNEGGVCLFGRAKIEEWTLYHSVHRTAQCPAAVLAFLGGPSISDFTGGNPATANCEALGGTYNGVEDELGEWGYCHFSDGSQIGEWTLYNGPGSSSNLALANLLKSICE